MHLHILPNGLRVWFQPNPSSKSVVALVVLRSGLRYEDRSNNGLAHFVEHMVFSGTARWSAEDLREQITRRGGRINAWTGLERTTFFTHVTAGDLALALQWLVQVVFHPTFPVERLGPERQIIFQEMRGNRGWLLRRARQLSFGGELSRKVRQALFPSPSFGMRVLGEEASLKRIDRDALIDYHRHYYVPANAVLVVVGGIALEELLREVEGNFGELAREDGPALPTCPPLPHTGPQRVVVRAPMFADRIRVRMGARTVGRTHPDRWPLEVLAHLFRRSVKQELRFRRGLVYGLRCYNVFYDDAGFFTIATTSDRCHQERILEVMENHLERFRKGEIEPKRVHQAQAFIKGRWALAMESNAKQAMWLARWASALPVNETPPDSLSSLDTVSPQDLSRVVHLYFTPQRRYLGLHLPVVTAVGAARTTASLAGAGLVLWSVRRLLSQKS
jgi:predicted Zn-dependent peptidase